MQFGLHRNVGANPLDGAGSDGRVNDFLCGRLGTIFATELAMGRCTRVTLSALFSVFAEAKRLSGHSDYVVIGSVLILGLEDSFRDFGCDDDVD